MTNINFKDYKQRFIEYYDFIHANYIILNDTMWVEYQKTIIPLGPINLNYKPSIDDVKYLLSKFPKSFLLKYTDGFNEHNNTKCNEWYAIIKSSYDDLDSLSSERRSEIRRGLKNCSVERIDAKYLSLYGYEVYSSAFKRYKGAKQNILTENNFKKKILERISFSDIFHHWGVFYDSKLIGYSENLIYGNIESNYSTIKLNPQSLGNYSSYALIHRMNEYYLKECGFSYVNDGFRSLLHQSNIQDFLIKKFSFIKKYTNLNVHYKPLLSLTLFIAFPLKKMFKNLHPKINALVKLEEIRRKCESFNK